MRSPRFVLSVAFMCISWFHFDEEMFDGFHACLMCKKSGQSLSRILYYMEARSIDLRTCRKLDNDSSQACESNVRIDRSSMWATPPEGGIRKFPSRLCLHNLPFLAFFKKYWQFAKRDFAKKNAPFSSFFIGPKKNRNPKRSVSPYLSQVCPCTTLTLLLSFNREDYSWILKRCTPFYP